MPKVKVIPQTIERPMLAVEADLESLVWPCIASPKLDGVRCLKVGGRALSRSFEPIANRHTREWIEDLLPDGIDGELMLRTDGGGTFNEIQSRVMRESGEPDLVFWAFDYAPPGGLGVPYIERIDRLNRLGAEEACGFRVLPTCEIHNMDQLLRYEAGVLDQGFEGVMLRHPASPYKCGRSTVKEGLLLKLKRFSDFEATIIGYEERQRNDNEATKSAIGSTKRSSHKSGLVGRGDLGALLLRRADGVEFKCGTGFDDATRKDIWDGREKYLGRLVTVKCQPHGAKDLPRFPVFKGFRPEMEGYDGSKD